MEVHDARAELCCQHLDSSQQAVKVSQQTELVDEDAMSQIRKGHDTMCVVLTSRHKNLDTVRAVWTTGNIKASASLSPHHGWLHFCFFHPHHLKLPLIEHLCTGRVLHSSL